MDKKLPDTPWHLGYAFKEDDDPRRHKLWCVYILAERKCNCPKSPYYQRRCGGSSHCKFYAEDAKQMQENIENNKTALEIDLKNERQYIASLTTQKLNLSKDDSYYKYWNSDNLHHCIICNSLLVSGIDSLKKCTKCGMYYLNQEDSEKKQIKHIIKNNPVLYMNQSRDPYTSPEKPKVIYKSVKGTNKKVSSGRIIETKENGSSDQSVNEIIEMNALIRSIPSTYPKSTYEQSRIIKENYFSNDNLIVRNAMLLSIRDKRNIARIIGDIESAFREDSRVSSSYLPVTTKSIIALSLLKDKLKCNLSDLVCDDPVARKKIVYELLDELSDTKSLWYLNSQRSSDKISLMFYDFDLCNLGRAHSKDGIKKLIHEKRGYEIFNLSITRCRINLLQYNYTLEYGTKSGKSKEDIFDKYALLWEESKGKLQLYFEELYSRI